MRSHLPASVPHTAIWLFGEVCNSCDRWGQRVLGRGQANWFTHFTLLHTTSQSKPCHRSRFTDEKTQAQRGWEMSQHWAQPGLKLASDSELTPDPQVKGAETIVFLGSDALPFFQARTPLHISHLLPSPGWLLTHSLGPSLCWGRLTAANLHCCPQRPRGTL